MFNGGSFMHYHHFHKNHFLMKMNYTILGMMVVIMTSINYLSAQNECVGWATVDGLTTGGAGGTTTTVSDEAAFAAAVKGDSPKIVRISGTIALDEEVRPGSNTTIEGAAPGATVKGSLGLIGSSSEALTNVIVRNLILRKTGGGGEDAISVRRAHHIWIDHNDIGDSPDGLVDVTNGSNYVTISWNIISYSSSNASHRFALLFGNSDNNADEDEGKLKITLHHNWFSENVIERMPRARYGQIHVFNNYYSSENNNYCIGPGVQAKVVIESNYFENVKDPHKFYNDEPTAQIRINNDNQYINTTGKQDEGQGSAFTPPYPYLLDAGVKVKSIVMSGAGPFKVTAIKNKPKTDFIIKNNYSGTLAGYGPKRFIYTLQGRLIAPAQAGKAMAPHIVIKDKPVVIIKKD